MNQPAVLTAGLLISLALLYFLVLRRWQLTWGARPDELAMVFPGDEIVEQPSFNATRGITVNAPPENIYPWIVQMGLDRAGWYSYDLLDNLARKSAEEILPRFQHVQPGDLIPMSPDGKQGLFVKEFEKDHWMLWGDQVGDSSWAWMILPDDSNRSRLLTRVRMKYRWLSPAILFSMIVEFSDFPMMRKCMLGIKGRAESTANPRSGTG